MAKIVRPISRFLGLSQILSPRTMLARKYLSGKGLEVGAMNAPVRLPRNTTVQYVDIATREESIQKFPELDPSDIVDIDYIANGFTLQGVPDGQFDFLIANHVLEHSPNPIGVLVRWL